MKNNLLKAYLDTAAIFAEQSHARRLKVGAIIVKNNRIISIGWNGTPSGWDNNCEHEITWPNGEIRYLTTKEEVFHAEENAIIKLAKCGESGEGGIMFSTHAPCIHCAKMILGSGIIAFYYKHEYKDEKGLNFLNKSGIFYERYERC